MRAIEKTWEKYLDALRDRINATAPEIMPQFEETLRNIHDILGEMKDKVHAALRGLSECASYVHPEFLGALREQLGPIFEESLEIKGKTSRFRFPITSCRLLNPESTGTGHFQKRRKFLYDNVKECGDDMFEAGSERMHKKYRMNVNKLPQAFSEMASFAGAKVTTQISLLMDRLGGASGQEWYVKSLFLFYPTLQGGECNTAHQEVCN
jgi:hypothetical protein